MKKILLPFFLVLLPCLIFAQDEQTTLDNSTDVIKRCSTADAHAYLMASDSAYRVQQIQMEQYVEKWISDNPNYEMKTTVTIPVVVHIIYKTTAENVSDVRVHEQIAETNADWAGTNSHSMGSFATTLKANTGIQFCLATIDPNGNPTNGITRTQTTKSSFSITGYPQNCTGYPERCTSSGGCDAWDVNKYLNIWVCNAGSSLCGISEFPTNPLNNYYGTTIHYQFFGHTGASAPYNLGGTYTHEAGHCFNLYHIWGDDGGGCSGSDNCNDTPNQASENYGALSGMHTDACTTTSPGIMYMNFMDYSDDISYANFTPNQVARIQAMIAANGACHALSLSTRCSGAGITETEAISDITIYPNPTQGMINISFRLTNADNVEITVSNLLGDVVSKVTRENVTSVNLSLDLTDQSSGIYYVQIKSGSQTLTKKISLF